MGLDAAPQIVGDPVRMSMAGQTTRLSIFPLPGALLFPRMHLPLHIFEPRYRAMISDAMARDRRIGMIQPRANKVGRRDTPPLFEVGCVGKIGEFEASEDGRYNLVLEGLALFRIVRELDVTTAFRQVEAELLPVGEEPETLSLSRRSLLETESRAFADAHGYAVDWDQVTRLDDEALVNGIAQIAPFDVAAKQALLEAGGIEDRAELIIQLMQFFGRHDGEDSVTLQ
jgi:Lon protease-like protein